MKNNFLTQTKVLLISLFLPVGLFAQPIENLALQHIEKTTDKFRLVNSDLESMKLTDYYQSTKSGVHHFYYQQRYQSIRIDAAHINLNLTKDGRVLNMGCSFVPELSSKVNGQLILTASQAFHFGTQLLNLDVSIPAILEQRLKGERQTVFEHQGLALKPITAHLVYAKEGKNSYRLCWELSYYPLHGQNWWVLKIDAEDGHLVSKRDHVLKCNFGNPNGSCPSEKGHHDCGSHLTATTGLETIENPDSYLVYPIGIESPNHGSRVNVVNPANPLASPFGWHDNDGLAGAEFNFTRGNNVLAQEDTNGNNGNGLRADGGTSLDFQFNLDFSQSPETENATVQNQSAAITNLFYWNNIMHDLWYQYGFDEVSGNFQENNYGKGGIGGDYVFADAQDGVGTNNANFSADVDGTNPRMQMYLWNGGGSTVTFNVNSPAGLVGTYTANPAIFGPNSYNVTGDLVIVDANVGVPSQGCGTLNNATDVNGNIAVIDRGDCEFGTKVLEAQNAGAIAAIICNNTSGTFNMPPGVDGGNVTIPAVMVSQGDCANIRTFIPGVNASLSAFGTVSEIDGDLDNGIIAHEYGHGISLRLTGGPASPNCLVNAEQPGEGWSDWIGMIMTQQPGDTRNTLRPIGTYAAGQVINGPGIRTYPYTTDIGINQHTYNSIQNEIIPHGVGSVWCAMIWDLYWNLIDEHGYDSNLYTGDGGNNIAMNLIIEGMKLQPCNPGFIDARDAIIAADQVLYNGANYCLIWASFARRGLGYSADQGDSNDVTDGVEAYDLPPSLDISKSSDVEEASLGDKITFTLVVTNQCTDATNVIVSDILPPGLVYNENSATNEGSHSNGVITWPTIPLLQKGEVRTYSYEVDMGEGTTGLDTLINDDLENGNTSWTTSNTNGGSNWILTSNPACGSTSWFAAELEANPGVEYQYMVSQPIAIQANTMFSFNHSFDTEVNWDGGQVQISIDGGNKWLDLGDNMIVNGYNDYIRNNVSNPAFSGQSGGNGQCIQTVINLNEYCGVDDALIRFVFYYDQLTAGNGWYVDDIFISTENAVVNTAKVETGILEVIDFACVKINEGALPLELLSFRADALERSILLNWSTTMEVGNAGFSLLRKAENELHFKPVGWIEAKEWNTGDNYYRFEDNTVVSNRLYYYQLVQVDLNGKESRSDVVSAIINKDDVFIEVFPNPVTSAYFEILLKGNFDDLINVELLNAQEQLVQSYSSYNGHVKVDTKNLASGIYFVVVKTEKSRYVEKVVVNH